jgi:sterol desaturase/sphingolipid hydroxylase (fatty acid hydroxylase superfamily)
MKWLAQNEWYALLSLLASVAVFDAWERLRPARPNDRDSEWRLDCIAFGAVIGFKHFFEGQLDAAVAGWAAHPWMAPLRILAGVPTAGKILLALVMLDFTLYWIHRAQHTVDALWPTHVWHHTIHHLYWLSMFRVSLVHLACYAIPQAAIMLALQMTMKEVAIASLIAVVLDFWVHSNIAVSLGPLDRVLVTPRYHRVHHAADERMRLNLAFVFTVWDRLFGTYLDPAGIPDSFPLGIPAPDSAARTTRMIIGV